MPLTSRPAHGSGHRRPAVGARVPVAVDASLRRLRELERLLHHRGARRVRPLPRRRAPWTSRGGRSTWRTSRCRSGAAGGVTAVRAENFLRKIRGPSETGSTAGALSYGVTGGGSGPGLDAYAAGLRRGDPVVPCHRTAAEVRLDDPAGDFVPPVPGRRDPHPAPRRPEMNHRGYPCFADTLTEMVGGYCGHPIAALHATGCRVLSPRCRAGHRTKGADAAGGRLSTRPGGRVGTTRRS